MNNFKLILTATSILVSLLTHAQSFSSNDLIVFEEGTTGTVVDIDADLGSGTDTGITYSISGGDDAALFGIEATGGSLTFNNTPNFDAPLDADANNIYQVEVTASLGATSETQRITIIVSPTVNPLLAPVQIGSTITGLFETDFAFTSELSADGSTLAVGSFGGNSFTGEVKVYQNINGTWTQVGGTITGTEFNDQFGISLDLSYDGSTIVIGAGKASNGFGTISIYELETGTWTQVGSTIVGDNEFDEFGFSVSISADGSIVAAGAHLNGNSGDRAYVKIYENVSGSWTLVGDLIPSDFQGDFFGYDVSLSADGSTLAVGAPLQRFGGSTPIGEAIIYRNISGTWTQIGDKLPGNAISDQGFSLSMNAAGDIVAIGAPRDNSSNGAVRVFSFQDDNWSQVGGDIDGTRNRLFGYSVSLSADGTTMAIGEQVDPTSPTGNGSAYIYQFSANQWTQLGSRIDGDNDGDNFGASVSLSADGSTLSAGGPFLNGDPTGYVKVYNLLNNPPVFSTTSSQVFNENEVGVIVDINATNEGGSDDDGISYSISGGADQSFFDVDNQTGALTLVNALNFESPGDANTDNVYELIVTADDGAVTTDLALQINIQDVNESPVITSASTVSLDENIATVLSVVATDEDAGASVSLTLGSAKDESLFQLIGGDLSFLVAPDHETPGDSNSDNIYEVDVTATDGSLSTTQTIIVTINDLNDNTPVFVTEPSIDFDENTIDALTIEATDADASSSLTYSLQASPDQGFFTLTDNSLTFDNVPNFENPGDANMDNDYELVVRVTDGTFTVDQNIIISIQDVNEAPAFTSGTTVSIDENTIGTVLTVAAIDEDAGNTVSFTLSSGNDEAAFNISGDELSFIAAPDAENPLDADGDNVYEVGIIATDGSLETVQMVTITVGDVNDNSPVFIAAIDVDENTAEVMNVAATDSDQTSVITVEIGTDKDADFFSLIDESKIEFKSAPDFENPQDGNGDNVYEFELFVSDGLFETIQTVQVTVIDVDEFVLSADEPGVAVTVFPNPVTDVLNISSADEPITWRLVSLSGQVILGDTNAKHTTSVNVSDVQSGAYIIQLDNGTEQTNQRIIIRH